MKYLMRMMNLFLPTCEEVALLASQAMDEPLRATQGVRMRLHIMACIFCRRNAQQLRLIRALIRKATPSAGTGERLSAEGRQRIAKAIDAAGLNPSA